MDQKILYKSSATYHNLGYIFLLSIIIGIPLIGEIISIALTILIFNISFVLIFLRQYEFYQEKLIIHFYFRKFILLKSKLIINYNELSEVQYNSISSKQGNGVKLVLHRPCSMLYKMILKFYLNDFGEAVKLLTILKMKGVKIKIDKRLSEKVKL